jgi:hypothetical protein
MQHAQKTKEIITKFSPGNLNERQLGADGA